MVVFYYQFYNSMSFCHLKFLDNTVEKLHGLLFWMQAWEPAFLVSIPLSVSTLLYDCSHVSHLFSSFFCYICHLPDLSSILISNRCKQFSRVLSCNLKQNRNYWRAREQELLKARDRKDNLCPKRILFVVKRAEISQEIKPRQQCDQSYALLSTPRNEQLSTHGKKKQNNCGKRGCGDAWQRNKFRKKK